MMAKPAPGKANGKSGGGPNLPAVAGADAGSAVDGHMLEMHQQSLGEIVRGFGAIDKALTNLSQMVDRLVSYQEAPREIIPGPDGKARAVRIGNVVRPIRRDPATGRPLELQ